SALAPEPPAFGEHADAPRATSGVLDGELGGIRNLSELPSRRRGALDLGDHGDTGLAERGVRVARGRGGLGEFADLLQRNALLPQRDILPNSGDDLLEHVDRLARSDVVVFGEG